MNGGGVKRAEFEHAIRAAGAVLGANEVLVIGSQALHGSVTRDLPPEAARSVDVDIAALRGDPDGAKADLIDGSIGEASLFHSTFGYYAQGVVQNDRCAAVRLAQAPGALRNPWDVRGCGVVSRAA